MRNFYIIASLVSWIGWIDPSLVANTVFCVNMHVYQLSMLSDFSFFCHINFLKKILYVRIIKKMGMIPVQTVVIE